MGMVVDKQYSVFLVNTPGSWAKGPQARAAATVNIKALTLVDSQEHGVLRMVPEEGAKAATTLRALNIPITETEVLSVEMANHPGSLADVCNRLAQEHININYAYCTTGSKGGKTIGIFKVSDINKAKSVLEVRKPIRKSQPMKRPARK